MIDSDFRNIVPASGSAHEPVLVTGAALWLLQVIFNGTGAAPDGLEGFLASLAEDEVEDAVYQLLPLSADHLEAVIPGDPLKTRLRGIQRLTWYKNQLLLSGLPHLLGEFLNAEISTILIGDAASELLLYEKRFVRPVHDLTLLIDSSKYSSGFDVLRGNGWKPKSDLQDGNLMFIAGQRFVKEPEGHELELRWHVLSTCCYPNADLDFWSLAQPANIEGVSTCTLNATDLLLYLVVQVFHTGRNRRVLWIADALKILQNSCTEIDWDRLLAEAKRRSLLMPLRTLLNFLGLYFEIRVPAAVVGELHQMPFSVMERLEARYRRRKHDQRLLGDFPLLYFDHLRNSKSQKGTRSASGFSAYLKEYWQVSSNSELLQLMILLSKRRIWSKLSKVGTRKSEKVIVNDT